MILSKYHVNAQEHEGRGWIAKRNIPENTFLMVSKVFKIVFNINEGKRELITRISQSLLAEPDLHQEVYQLCCGTNPVTLKSLTFRLSNTILLRHLIILQS